MLLSQVLGIEFNGRVVVNHLLRHTVFLRCDHVQPFLSKIRLLRPVCYKIRLARRKTI